MKEYRFTLDRSSRKFICPSCQKKRFVRFVDREIGHFLPEIYGRCDREQSCNYFLKPGSNSLFHSITHHEPKRLNNIISIDLMHKSLSFYQQNNFVSWFKSVFNDDQVQKLIKNYFIGTSKSGCIFWQVDQANKVRAGKIIQYDPATGHRRKDLTIKWVHKILNLKDFTLKQCLFGLHLTKGLKPGSIIAICESEKTAIVCSAFFPDLIWLATGGLQNLSSEKLEPLKRFRIMLFPDCGAFEQWNNKAAKIRREIPGIMLKVSDYLETNTNETHRAKGFDLADYLTDKQLQNGLKSVLSRF